MTEYQIRQKVVNAVLGWEGGTFGGERHYDILNTYNSHKPLARNYAIKPTDAYCAATASAAWIRAGVANIAPLEVSVPKMVTLAQQAGIWVENDAYVPKPGDAVVYDWEDNGKGDDRGYPDHVGIVVDVSGGVISVIEGNKGAAHMIGRRDLAVNGRYIRGFVCPKFATLATPEKTVTDIAKEVIAGKWGNGAERKRRLTAAGWDYKAVQAEVNRILKGDKPPKVRPAKSFSVKVAGKYTAKAELTLRCGPGTGYQAIKTLTKGTVVRCYGFYTRASDGVRWLYVRVNNSDVVGYADERMLSK